MVLAALYQKPSRGPGTKKVMDANLKLFDDLDGLKTVVGCLNFGYKEIKNL